MKESSHNKAISVGARIRQYLQGCLFATLASLVIFGCGATSQDIQNKQDAPSELEILYNSILHEYRARDLEIALASTERLLVASEFDEFAPDQRRRYVSRIMAMPNGIALNVSAEYQKLDHSTSPASWTLMEDGETKLKAEKDEGDIGAGIQARYHESAP